MLRKILVVAFLSWMTHAYSADHHIAKEHWGESEQFKVEKPMKEQDVKRSLAGGKFKKKKDKSADQEVSNEAKPSSKDSEVQYWKYSE